MSTPKDMISGYVHNTKNGDIKVLKYHDRTKVEVEFVKSGYRTVCKSQTVREGRLTDRLSPTVLGVATIGVGKYRNTINYKTTPEYKCWIGIIYRCYYEKHCNYHRYGGRGVTVCREWLNFQNFAEWYHKSKPEEEGVWEVDKDIKIDGNLIYSPDTCAFVSKCDNSEKANAKTFKMRSPKGDVVEFYNMAKFCKDNNLIKSNLHRVYSGGRKSHRGWTRA